MAIFLCSMVEKAKTLQKKAMSSTTILNVGIVNNIYQDNYNLII